ncbi:MAG TPA: peptidyl-prolyl cis-trans isomerase [Terriglobales bacterium]
MPSARPRLLILPLAALLTAGSFSACRWLRPAPAADVVATVNGQPIEQPELDRLYNQQTAGAAAPLSHEQRLQLQLSLLGQLIDRHILLQYAAHLGISVDPAQVTRAMDIDRGSAAASTAPLDEQSLRQQATDTLLLNQLMQREVGAKIEVTDQQIADFYQANQASFHLPEPQYHVLAIVTTPRPGSVTNLAQDKAATPAAARQKIAMLRRRLAANADFASLAQQYSEDPATAASGGDLGLIPQSVLMNQTPAPLRDAILALRPGQISPPVDTPNGEYLLKLLAIEPAGVRPLTDAQVRQSIHDLLAQSRQQVLQAAFLATVRDQARVVNYLAQRVLAGSE